MIIKTQGRARQKAFTLAKKAGVELKTVVFTRPQLIEALGYEPGKRYGTKRDNCCGRCWQTAKIIWLRLPTSVATIAHEVTHLVTSISHNTRSFEDKEISLVRGYAPGQHKAHWFEVTVNTTTAYRVFELTASAAKKHYLGNNPIRHQQTITAKSIKN